MTTRIATFNAENLFSRARIINQADHGLSKKLLNSVATLDGLLKKPKYSAADKAKIEALFKSLADYIDIRENRGKLFDRKGKVVASGSGAWDGGSRSGSIGSRRSSAMRRRRS